MIIGPCIGNHYGKSSRARHQVLGKRGYESETEDADSSDDEAKSDNDDGFFSSSSDEDASPIDDDDSDSSVESGSECEVDSDVESSDDEPPPPEFADTLWSMMTKMFQRARVAADHSKIGDRDIPADPDSNFQADLQARAADITGGGALNAPQYLKLIEVDATEHTTYTCVVAGETAVVAHLTEDVWAHWKRNSDGSAAALAQLAGKSWVCDVENKLYGGDYYLQVGDETVRLRVVVYPAHISYGGGVGPVTTISCEMVNEGDYVGFLIQFTEAGWNAFMAKESGAAHVQALAAAVVNGVPALAVGCCSYAPFAPCPLCRTADTATNTSAPVGTSIEDYPKLHTIILRRTAGGTVCDCLGAGDCRGKRKRCKCVDVSDALVAGYDNALQDEKAPSERLEAASATVNGTIDYLLSRILREEQPSRDEFQRSVQERVNGSAVLEFLVKNLGEVWTSDFVGDDVSRLQSAVLGRLREVYGKPTNQIKSLALMYYDQWMVAAPARIDPRFPRGMRVLAHSQNRNTAAVNAGYKGWYPGRIIGAGAEPGTYEILFDESLEGEEDRHPKTYPFLDGTSPSEAFFAGTTLGTGTCMIKEIAGDYGYASKVEAQ